MRHDLAGGFDRDRVDVLGAEATRCHQIAQELHRYMRGDMAGIALEADALDLEHLAEPLRQQRWIVLLAERLQHSIASLDHIARPLVAAAREPHRQHTRFGGAAEMQALHHSARARLCERQQPARERARDPECMRGLAR
jgi:hypothetical protein